jgi:signal transduction histidine kinase
MDLLFAFAALRRALPVSDTPLALAGASVGIFACIAVFAALTQSARLIATMTILGVLCTAVLQREVGMPDDLIAVCCLMLVVTALVTSWSALRLERLSGRLVREEVARALAVGRGEELERWNERVTAMNGRLEEQHARLLSAQREAETMMGLLVHDMKQPLASIQGLVEVVADHLARDRPPVERLQSDLEIVRGQSQRLLAMIADLHAIARLEKGSMTACKQPARLKPFLSAVVDAHQARAHGVAIAVSVEETTVAIIDHELVQRMIENLLANALSFTRPGDRIEISARSDGPHVALAVKNSGPPVPPEVRPFLFEKLVTRAGRARHNAGLGLYFCRLVAEAHGGRISLEPDLEFRVAFVVRLPADADADTPAGSNRLTSLLDSTG